MMDIVLSLVPYLVKFLLILFGLCLVGFGLVLARAEDAPKNY